MCWLYFYRTGSVALTFVVSSPETSVSGTVEIIGIHAGLALHATEPTGKTLCSSYPHCVYVGVLGGVLHRPCQNTSSSPCTEPGHCCPGSLQEQALSLQPLLLSWQALPQVCLPTIKNNSKSKGCYWQVSDRNT